jgi:hypothetical protein
MSMNRTLRPTGKSVVSRSDTVRTEINRLTHSYTALAQATRALKLQGRTRWFYWLLFAALVAALGAGTGLVLLEECWLELLIAGALGVISTQFAFLGHEASHRQVLASGPHLRKARQLVREHCGSNDVPYTETSLITASGIVSAISIGSVSPLETRSSAPIAGRLRGR